MTVREPDRRPRQRASEFLRVASLYQLGVLPTEQPHPRTLELSRWALHDLPRAIATLKAVDLDALGMLQQYVASIDRLARRVVATLEKGRRIYLCGCGATGRLSLSLEYLWRGRHPGSDQVRSFMAGGDIALVHSLEGFEDHPGYGARHLEQMGYEDGDLLIACTEGGETPYVIGATERAAQLSTNRPIFLYCNPDAILAGHIERFRRVQDNPRIETMCLDVGPMALTGSTRMQASTVLQLAVGVALLQPEIDTGESIASFRALVAASDLSFLSRFIEAEARVYASGDHVTYQTSQYGITVLTDTTERAPTFSLVPFDQLNTRTGSHSLCYVSLDSAADASQAWMQLLSRPPRPLNWPEVDPRTTPEYLAEFDFSARAVARRQGQLPGKTHHVFRIGRSSAGIGMEFDGHIHDLSAADTPELFDHLLLKQTLNIHSTLVMGRLGRYEGNLMTWVSPTNGKLVDRAARYVGHLLERRGSVSRSYEEIVHQLFCEMDRAAPDEPVVLRTFRSLLRHRGAKNVSS